MDWHNSHNADHGEGKRRRGEGGAAEGRQARVAAAVMDAADSAAAILPASANQHTPRLLIAPVQTRCGPLAWRTESRGCCAQPSLLPDKEREPRVWARPFLGFLIFGMRFRCLFLFLLCCLLPPSLCLHLPSLHFTCVGLVAWGELACLSVPLLFSRITPRSGCDENEGCGPLFLCCRFDWGGSQGSSRGQPGGGSNRRWYLRIRTTCDFGFADVPGCSNAHSQHRRGWVSHAFDRSVVLPAIVESP